jgi:hypothetical protein
MITQASTRVLTTILFSLFLSTACDSGLPSRFDEVSGVDLCQLISPAEAEHILGPLQDTKSSVTSGSTFAGDCTWTFKSLSSGKEASLFVLMMTAASAPPGTSPGRFMAISQPEVEASLGANPWPMQNLGDQAFLYQTSRPEHSELWLLQSHTLLTFRMLGGSSAQLEQFARALSREMTLPAEPKG